MKAIFIEKPWDVKVTELQEPVVEKGMACIRVVAAGICGSDIGAYRGANQMVSYPRIIGHEIAGEIVSIGEDNLNGLKPGDRVVVDPYLYCGKCYPCSLGRTNCCEDLKVLGVQTDGGMSEYYVHPQDMLVKIPEGMSYEMAALSEPLTISLHGLHRGQLKSGEHAAICGAGPIGIMAALAAVHYGAEPIVIDIVDERLKMVRDLGVKHTINPVSENPVERIAEITGGRMAEMVLEASGANSSIQSTLEYASYAGRIVFTGWPKQNTDLPTGIITKKELDIRGGRTSAGEFREALDMIANGDIDITPLLTKVVSIDEAPETIRDIEANPGNYIKTVVMM